MTKSDALEGKSSSNRWSGPLLKTGLAAMAFLMFFQAAADARTIYVNGAKATAGDGSTWKNAFIYLRDALDASVAGDRVFIAKGIYFPDDGATGFFGDRELSFEVSGVNLYGGFSGTETSIDERDVASNPTTLSGEIWQVDPAKPLTADYQRYWSLHVVVLKSSATFDGLTIERGRANGEMVPYNRGGGVLISGGTLTLANCSINECLAAQDGGAVFGNVVASNCTFSGNRCDNEWLLTDSKLNDPDNTQHSWLYSSVCSGGAITGNVNATDCKFLNNHARVRSLNTGYTSTVTGGAIAGTVSARYCTFDGNTASSSSYGGFVDALATAKGGAIAGTNTVVNCVFTNNEANTIAQNFPSPDPKKPIPYVPSPYSMGGAISGKTGATNCVFSANVTTADARSGDWGDAQSFGGGIYAENESNAINCVFVKNETIDIRPLITSGGGGIRASSSAVIPVMNCTFLNNFTTGGGTCLSVGGNVKILSNIFWDTLDPAAPAVLIWVDGSGNENARARISNRLYPTPSTETINIVKGGLTGIDENFSNTDFGDPKTRTLPNVDPLFVCTTNPGGLEGLDGVLDTADDNTPEGPDGIWKTADDGLRLTATTKVITDPVTGAQVTVTDTVSPAIGQGHLLFLPIDIFDLDEDVNATETTPVDVANFARLQANPARPPAEDPKVTYLSNMDLGAYEFGKTLYSAEIQVEQPANSPLKDDIRPHETPKPDPKQEQSDKLDIPVYFKANTGDPDVRTFTIKNVGNLPLKQLSVNKGGKNSADFTITQPLRTSIGPNAVTTFSVIFSSTTAGMREAWLRVTSNDIDENPFDILLLGEMRIPDIAVEYPVRTDLRDGVSVINYGTVAALSSSTKTFTIRNAGLGDLKITGLSSTGTSAKEYKISGPVQTKLIAGETATFRVAFWPADKGTRTATININSNDPDQEGTFTIKVTGNGIIAPEIAVSQPSSVGITDGGTKSFGSVKTGLAYTKTFTIKNVGSDRLKLGAVSLSGSGTYTKTKISKSNLDPGEKATFAVTFKPKSTGTKTAAITIKSNDSDENPFNINLTGTGYSSSRSAAKSALADVSSASTKPGAGVLTVARESGGLEYLVLTVAKTPGWSTARHEVEVSPNLVDWFSGEKHTTTLLNDSSILKVRDNTPVKQGEKRYIRLK